MNISSGGLAILAIAAVWFLVFLPSFAKGDQAKVQKRVELQKAREATQVRLGEFAHKALKAKRGRNILISLSAISLAIFVLSLLEFAATANGLVTVLIAGGSSLVFWALFLRANSNFRNMVANSLKRTIPISSPKSKIIDEAPVVESNTWQPTEIPKQSYLQTGSIEIVKFAEVVSIEPRETQNELANIDEILRRRRHVG